MKEEIKYIGFYDLPNSKSDRVSSIAAIKKMNYVSSAINKAGFKVNIISPSWMEKNSKIQRQAGEVKKINDQTKVTFCPSWVTKNKISKGFKIIFSLLWLFIYLMMNTKKSEKVVVYHVYWISTPIRLARFFKRFELILEVEEVYQDIWSLSKLMSHLENKLIDAADSYIYVSELLRKRLKKTDKKSLILYGGYNSVQLKTTKQKSSMINLVYAGSIDSTKGGAFKALDIMRYLPDSYKLHILGYGNSQQVAKLQVMIKAINNEKNKEVCVYLGTLHGQEYSDYLLECDLALNPQIQGDYMLTAFPSKILSYLTHNLRVVSTEIKSVKQSRVSEYIYFAKNDNSEEFAEVIKNIDLSLDYNSSDFINNLDKEFINNLKHLLED